MMCFLFVGILVSSRKIPTFYFIIFKVKKQEMIQISLVASKNFSTFIWLLFKAHTLWWFILNKGGYSRSKYRQHKIDDDDLG